MVHFRSTSIIRCIASYLFAVMLMFALIGCSSTSLTQVRQLGQASTSLGENARKAFNLVDDTSVERKLFDVAADPEKGPSDDTFKGFFTGGASVFGAGEKAERLNLRLNVLEQLVAYSEALQKLAEADQTSGLDTASKELNVSLISLRDSFNNAFEEKFPITNADIGIISTSVNAITKAIVESKRRSAIKTTVIKVDPAVQRATKLISDDLGKDAELAKFVMESIANSRGSVQQAYNLERQSSLSTFEARYSLLLQARQLYEAESNTPNLFAAVSNGASTMGKAHSALRKALEVDDFSSTELAEYIGQLEVYAKSVQNYYNSIKE